MKVSHPFRDDALLRQALTHPSWANEQGPCPDNQRLEFLGDAVAGLVATELLYDARPAWPEGALHRARASMVKAETFARLARDLELGPHIRLAQGQTATKNVLADAFEAVVAAVWLDGGLDAARAFLVPLLRPLVDALPADPPGADPTSRVQEIAQARGLPFAFREVGREGPPHDLTFQFVFEMGGEVYGPGVGPSKIAAKAAAAAMALRALEVG